MPPMARYVMAGVGCKVTSGHTTGGTREWPRFASLCATEVKAETKVRGFTHGVAVEQQHAVSVTAALQAHVERMHAVAVHFIL